MKDTTFGSSKAAIDLLRILSKSDRRFSKKVSRLTCKFSYCLSCIQKIEDKRIRLFLMTITKNEILKNTENLPDEIKRFTKNVITSRFRRALADEKHPF